jgi:hypothetical protein
VIKPKKTSPARKVIHLDEKGKKAEPILKKSASATDFKEQQDAAQPTIHPDLQELELAKRHKYKKKERKEVEKPEKQEKVEKNETVEKPVEEPRP